MAYLEQETKPKALTGKNEIQKGGIGLGNLDAALFLAIELIKLHTHTGVDSRQLTSDATPESVRGYRPKEREEHGTATWTGTAAASGSIVLTFGTPFTEAPEVLVSPRTGSANHQASTGTPTTTGVTIYWKDDTGGTHTSVVITWLAKGR